MLVLKDRKYPAGWNRSDIGNQVVLGHSPDTVDRASALADIMKNHSREILNCKGDTRKIAIDGDLGVQRDPVLRDGTAIFGPAAPGFA